MKNSLFAGSGAGTVEAAGINYSKIGKNIGSEKNHLDLIKLGAYRRIWLFHQAFQGVCQFFFMDGKLNWYSSAAES